MAVRCPTTSDNMYRSSIFPNSYPITIAQWVYLPSAPGSYACMWGMDIGGTDQSLYVGATSGGTNLEIYTSGSGGEMTGSTLPIGKWFHLAATSNNVTVKGYLNGILDINSASTVNGSAVVGMGVMNAGGGYDIVGIVGYCKVWEDILTQSEIQREMLTTNPTVKLNKLWAYWPLVHPADISDYSGRAHHLTRRGAPVVGPAPGIPTDRFSRTAWRRWPMNVPAAGKAPPPFQRRWRYLNRSRFV